MDAGPLWWLAARQRGVAVEALFTLVAPSREGLRCGLSNGSLGSRLTPRCLTGLHACNRAVYGDEPIGVRAGEVLLGTAAWCWGACLLAGNPWSCDDTSPLWP